MSKARTAAPLALVAAGLACGSRDGGGTSQREVATPTAASGGAAASTPTIEVADFSAGPDLSGVPTLQGADGGTYLAKEIVVRRGSGVDDATFRQAIADIGGTIVEDDSLLGSVLGYRRVRLDAPDPDGAIEALHRGGVVERAERNYVAEIDVAPNDSFYGQQWDPGAMGAEAAWEVTTGSRDVVVAVLDTGVDTAHPDLKDNVWKNPGEIAGNGVDDDGNGTVDDVVGWDCVEHDATPTDANGHGTHVAGTVGAVGNNGVGRVGVNWQVSIAAVRVCGGRYCYSTDIVEGFLYAASIRADVVNASFGGERSPLSYEQDAIETFLSQGGIVVAAAGNSSLDNDTRPHYPAAYGYEGLIAVAASTATGSLAGFSNFGAASVDLAAPGDSILSTLPGSRYGTASGTSMASPQVAGAAALYKAVHPDASAAEIRSAMLGGVRPDAGLSGKVATGGHLDLPGMIGDDDGDAGSGGAGAGGSGGVGGEPVEPGCGNGVVEAGEDCDDGNSDLGDGCTPLCEKEPDCAAGSCESLCGDGILLPGEPGCDDGNRTDGDGCSANCEIETGWECAAEDGEPAPTLALPIVLRDFQDTHPDFEGRVDVDPGIVADTLGADGKPVYAGGTTGTTSGQQYFDQWYRDVPGVNATVVKKLTFERQPGGEYVFEDTSFFPVDGLALGDQGRPHNYHFTSEIRHWFEYRGGERLEFTGDDDVWVFINDRLVIDLGGVHSALEGDATLSRPTRTVALSDRAADIGLSVGSVYEIVVFQAERHTTQSHYKLTLGGFTSRTSACSPVCGDGVVTGDEICDDGVNDGAYDGCMAGCRALGPRCGDGEQNGPEQCDDGSNDALCGGCGEGCQLVTNCCEQSPCDENAYCTEGSGPGAYSCTCQGGFTGDGQSCRDVDECATGSDTCDPRARCINEAGGYRCECHAGFTGDGTTCVDVDECQDSPCQDGATCRNVEGGYLCDCPGGYRSNGAGGCVDVDECDAGDHDCDANATCVNEAGGYRCECPAGFVGNGLQCVDVDECETGDFSCPVNTECRNTAGSYSCECAAGYEAEGGTCVDVDECVIGLHACDDHATCFNAQGSYTCVCNEGYSGDGFSCGDVDECALGICDPRASCENLVPGYACTCPDGFITEGNDCLDINECEADPAPCSAAATCTNTEGAYQCQCLPGFFGDGVTCGDVDECALGLAACGSNEVCSNTAGAYACLCADGYARSGVSGLCEDVDECADGSHGCDEKATCQNTDGGYTCVCAPGYVLVDGACENVDECQLDTDDCDDSATCKDTDGAWECTCQAGYAGDGVTCTDIDECADDPCGDHGLCNNQLGTYACLCDPGYEEKDGTCVDVDECAVGQAQCDLNAACVNTDGNYACECLPGYTGVGFICEDVDECALGIADCAPEASCTNTAGGFECACGAGFEGDGKTCSPVTGGGDGGSAAGGSGSSGGATVGGDGSGGDGGVATGGTGSGSGATGSGGDSGGGDTGGSGATGSGGDTGGGDNGGSGGEGTGAAGTGAGGSGAGGTGGGGAGGTGAGGSGGTGGGGQEPAAQVLTVSSHADFSCALMDNGRVRCWGRNHLGQLGLGHTDNLGDNEPVSTADYLDLGSRAVAIDAGISHSCALLETGAVRCWGRNYYGQLGTGTTTDIGDDELAVAATTVDLGGAVATQVSAGGEHSCALTDAGDVHCWGLAIDGQLGYGAVDSVGDDEAVVAAGVVPLGEPAVQISAGRDHTCALVGGGAVRCWGRNVWGQLGYGHTDSLGDDETAAAAATVPLPEPATAVSAGWYHTCALLESGQALCWGYGILGELGRGEPRTLGDDETLDGFDAVDLGGDAVELDAGLFFNCARFSDGGVKCWGYGDSGRLGQAATDNLGDDEAVALVPPIELGAGTVSIAAGYRHACAVLATGPVKCWGDGEFGQLGNGATGDLGDDETPLGERPVLLGEVDECTLGTDDCAEVATCLDEVIGFRCECPAGHVGDGTYCADIDECAAGADTCSDDATCTNTVGSYDCACDAGFSGDGETCADIDECAVTPCAAAATCTNTPGSYSCECDAGYVGDGTVCTPESVAVVQVVAGDAHSCALLNDGTVRCWGAASLGQLGHGNQQSIGDDEAPLSAGSVNVGGTVIALAAGANHTCALLHGGFVRCWGANGHGQLGLGGTETIGDDEEPALAGLVDVGGPVTQIAAGALHTCALLEGGDVRCWGAGAAGRLGYGNEASIGDNEPPSHAGSVALGGAATKVVAGRFHTCALLEAGAVRCWGAGGSGQLGTGSFAAVGDDETPAQVPALGLPAPATDINAGEVMSCALLTDGTVRCWGYGYYGSLGSGSQATINDASVAPVVALSGAPVALAAGGYRACAVLDGGAFDCWGDGTQGALGFGTTAHVGDDETPAAMGPVPIAGGIESLALGAAHTCALMDDETVRCWGSGGSGRLGTSSVTSVLDASLATPVALLGE